MSNPSGSVVCDEGKTLIISNGSHCYGQAPDSIEKLLDVLGQHTLCPRFEKDDCYKPFRNPTTGANHKWAGAAVFFGNFQSLSHVFRIVTKNARTIFALLDAIEKNVATDEYQKAAFRLYENWHIGKHHDRMFLVSPDVCSCIKSGEFPLGIRNRLDFDRLKQTEILGPRFTAEQAARYRQ